MTDKKELSYADQINNHLKNNGVVTVSTYLKSIQYDIKHVDWFFMRDNNLYVKSGRKSNCLSNGKMLLVSIKFYSYSD